MDIPDLEGHVDRLAAEESGLVFPDKPSVHSVPFIEEIEGVEFCVGIRVINKGDDFVDVAQPVRVTDDRLEFVGLIASDVVGATAPIGGVFVLEDEGQFVTECVVVVVVLDDNEAARKKAQADSCKGKEAKGAEGRGGS